jgi:hypothetical protein
LLEKLIPDSQQVSGGDSDEVKEEKFVAFTTGKLRVMVTKPKIGAWGLNLQNCHHITSFPSHSYEQYYQGVRRCWRFGQTHPVRVDMICTEGEKGVLDNLRRKAQAADRMFSELVLHMNEAIGIKRSNEFTKELEAPQWLKTN